jgi:hypothetical protein
MGSSAGLLFVDRELEYLSPDTGRGTSPDKIMDGDGVCCFCLYKFGFEGVLLSAEAGMDFSIGVEPVDFCSKSHVTQLSQGSVDEVSTAELWKEHLAVIVGKSFCPIKVWV